MRKFYFIAPHFPPDKGGLSDHSYFLLREMHAQEFFKTFDFVLVTGQKNPVVESFIQKKIVMPDWKPRSLFSLWRNIIQDRPEIVFIQYVPYMYGRFGINLFFPFFVALLRLFTKTRIQILLHELHFPLRLRIKHMILALAHFSMLMPLICFCHDIFTTTNYYCQLLKRYTLGMRDIIRLPVASNIPIVKQDTSNIVNGPELRILVFGGDHITRGHRFILEIFLQLYRQGLIFKLDFIGMKKEEILQLWHSEQGVELFKFMTAHGHLQAHEVSAFLQSCDLLISYFNDGISTRRTSAMTGLEHAIPIVSTYSKHSDSEFLSAPSIRLFSCDKEEFRHSLITFFKSGEYKELLKPEIKLLGQELYKKKFSWECMIETYIRSQRHVACDRQTTRP